MIDEAMISEQRTTQGTVHIRSYQLFHLCLHILRSNIHRRIRIIQHLVKQSQLSMAKIMSAGRRAPRVVGIRRSSRHTARRRRKRSRDRRSRGCRFRFIPRKRDCSFPAPLLLYPRICSACTAHNLVRMRKRKLERWTQLSVVDTLPPPPANSIDNSAHSHEIRYLELSV